MAGEFNKAKKVLGEDKPMIGSVLMGYDLLISVKNIPYFYNAEYDENEVNFKEAERMVKDLISKIKDLKDTDISVSEVTLNSMDEVD